ncbi:MAG: outer membrane beta-barrel protein [Legionellaceae bacterium]|nr:outer membrane beta-barrel protein [Legionellaceae bacterium]
MKIAVLFASVLASCASFAATPIDGWYTSLFGGYTYIPSNIDKTRFGLTRDHATYQSGFEGGGNFGFKSNPMRYEGDVTYLKASTNAFQINRVPQTDVSGYNQAIFGLANVYYDFPGFSTLLQPYLGAGLGYGWIQTRLNSFGPTGTTSFTAVNSAFAYQGTGGVTFNFAENYALSLGYRYISTLNLYEFGERFQAHIANLGATYRFDGNNYK